MRVWKRIPRLLTLVAMVLTVSACSGSSADGETATETAATTAPAAVPSAPKAATEPATSAKPANDIPGPPASRIERITLPAGTELPIFLAEPLHSGKNKSGDEFDANLADPVGVNGVTLLARGTKVHGEILEAQDSGRVKGLASLRMILTSVTVDGKTVPITTNGYFAEAEATKGRDVGVVGGGTAIGAAIGAIAGGKKGAATGAAIGGAAGAGTVLATKGKEVELPMESRLTFILSEDLTVTR